MPEERELVRRIAWREICPWLLLLRTFRLSISLPMLLLATTGALLTPLGWWISGALFIGEPRDGYFRATADLNARWPDAVGHPEAFYEALGIPRLAMPEHLTNVVAVYGRFTHPFQQLANLGDDMPTRVERAAYFLFGGFWNIALWALLAGALTRMAAVQLGREERISLREAVKYAGRGYLWYLASPLFPLLGVLLVALPIALFGLLMRLPVGILVGGILWWLALLAALVMAILLLGLMFGWPLMWPTISCEETGDAFEAFSRSYSYTFQRPLHYLFYAAVTLLFGALCWLLVSYFASAVVQLPLWAASWGAGIDQIGMIQAGTSSGMGAVGTRLIQLFSDLVFTVAAAFNYSFFFCSATAIYLLLRREVDQTDFDEVYVEEDEEEYGLPPMETPESRQSEVASREGEQRD